MKTTIEINKPLVATLRKSEALPNVPTLGNGALHLLYGENYRPVGYLVEKVNSDDAWESLDPRFFMTTSLGEALHVLAMPANELPSPEIATV